jgi:hypothetical protein
MTSTYTNPMTNSLSPTAQRGEMISQGHKGLGKDGASHSEPSELS